METGTIMGKIWLQYNRTTQAGNERNELELILLDAQYKLKGQKQFV